MKSLCHVSDMFREGKWKSLKFARGFVSDGERQPGEVRRKKSSPANQLINKEEISGSGMFAPGLRL